MDQIAPRPWIGAVLQNRPDLLGLVHSQESHRRIRLPFGQLLPLSSEEGRAGGQFRVDRADQNGQPFLALLLEFRIDHGELLVVGVHEQVGQHLRIVGGVVGQQVRRQHAFAGLLGLLVMKNDSQRIE